MSGYGFFRLMARCYIDLQQLRIAAEARLRKLRERGAPDEVVALMDEYRRRLAGEEKAFLKDLRPRLEAHPLWEWCGAVRGMGPVAALTFLGFINPEIATTAGKAKAYLGLIPGARLRSGERGKFNPQGKGRVWLVTRNVIVARDSYYKPLYDAKKRYYLERARVEGAGPTAVKWPPFQEILEDPERCPRFEGCVKGLRGRAERLGRKPKRPPCRAHLDNLARRWLSGLLVGHAAELLRRAEGLPVESFMSHRGYIPPKPGSDEVPPQDLLDAIAGGPKVTKNQREPDRWASHIKRRTTRNGEPHQVENHI